MIFQDADVNALILLYPADGQDFSTKTVAAVYVHQENVLNGIIGIQEPVIVKIISFVVQPFHLLVIQVQHANKKLVKNSYAFKLVENGKIVDAIRRRDFRLEYIRYDYII